MTASLRFYGQLNRFLPPSLRQKTVSYGINGRVAVKHAIESLGTPHTEVALILANGEPVGFKYLLQPADRIAIYPHFTTLEVAELAAAAPLRPPLERPPRFILDSHLGRLTTYLRLLGFDALYRNDYDDAELAELAGQTGRVLVTRDRRLLMRREVIHGCCLTTRDSREQLLAVLRRYDLFDAIDPWQRCLRCNGQLELVAKETVLDELEPLTKLYYDEFKRCQACAQIFWQGSHYEPLREFVAAVMRGEIQ